MMAPNRREACAGGISLWQRRGRRSLSDVETSSEEEEGGLAELRKHAETEDKVLDVSATSDTFRHLLCRLSTEAACDAVLRFRASCQDTHGKPVSSRRIIHPVIFPAYCQHWSCLCPNDLLC